MTAAVSTSPKPTLGTIVRNGAIGTGIATVINALLYLIGSLFTFPPDALGPTGDPVTLVGVIIVSVLGGVAATVGYLILSRFLSGSTLNYVMIGGAVLVLIGMFAGPFGIENVDTAQIVILQIMHFVAALPVYFLLRR